MDVLRFDYARENLPKIAVNYESRRVYSGKGTLRLSISVRAEIIVRGEAKEPRERRDDTGEKSVDTENDRTDMMRAFAKFGTYVNNRVNIL